MSTQLWLDDERDPDDFVTGSWKWVKNYSAAIIALSTNKFQTVSLDNDLGEDKEGCDVLTWIEERLFTDPERLSELKTIYVHTANPSAKQKMMGARGPFKERYGIVVNILPSNIRIR